MVSSPRTASSRKRILSGSVWVCLYFLKEALNLVMTWHGRKSVTLISQNFCIEANYLCYWLHSCVSMDQERFARHCSSGKCLLQKSEARNSSNSNEFAKVEIKQYKQAVRFKYAFTNFAIINGIRCTVLNRNTSYNRHALAFHIWSKTNARTSSVWLLSKTDKNTECSQVGIDRSKAKARSFTGH